MVTKQDLANLELELKEKRDQYERQRAIERREVVKKLADLAKDIQEIVRQGKALASTVDMVFEWHEGYGEFVPVEEEWNSSSRYC